MSGRIHFVSAGAGTGKTFRLTEILRDELAAQRARSSGVIATTFTRKAATELRERVRRDLIRNREFALANAMGQARIGTVNSVCGQLLERFAFESGLKTQLTVLEEEQSKALVREALDSVREGTEIGKLGALAARLCIEDWQEKLQELIDHVRANNIPGEKLAGFAKINADDLLRHFPAPSKQDLTCQLLAAIDAALPALQNGGNGGRRNTAEYIGGLRSIARDLRDGRATWADWVRLSKQAPEARLSDIAESIAKAAARVVAHPALHEDIRAYLDTLFALCADTLKVYDDKKRALGAIDFTDQESLLLKTLEHPRVAAALSEELDLLLVDEFQDTSPIQLALFLRLAEFAKATFWVGDVKQAIYGFRGSDTALMQGILKALPGIGGDMEILGKSFRSRRPLVSLTNAVFVPAFASALPAEAVALEPVRKEILTSAAAGNWILGGRNKGEEYSALAGGLRRLIASGQTIEERESGRVRPVQYGDIAVLARANETVKEIVTTLAHWGVPTTTSQPGLLETPEAVLALACLRRLGDPGDTLATAEIVSLADSSEPERWVVDRLTYLAGGGDRQLWKESGDDAHPIVARLRELRADLPLLTPSEALELVIARCELSARVVRWQADPSASRRRLANLEALAALARSYEGLSRNGQRAATLSGLILWLNEQAAKELDFVAEPAVDAVKVLTHHGAKGLEWPVVILMDVAAKVQSRLWGISAQSPSGFVAGAPLEDRFIRYWPWPFGRQQRLALVDEIDASAIALQFRAAAIDENKRLFYVSMTRARDLLILARSKRNATGEWIDSLDAPWLMTTPGKTSLKAPGGVQIPCLHWELEPLDIAPVRAQGAEVIWFRPGEAAAGRPPLRLSPAAIDPVPCNVVECVTIGDRITLDGRPDMEALGSAIHACIAAAFTDPTAPLDEAEVGRILHGFSVAQQVSADLVLKKVGELRRWISERWPGGQPVAEVPIECILPNGQIVAGRIDLLVKLPSGWILIDHKSNPQGPEQWESVAQRYAGQMDAYADAITRATGLSVLESWLFFPVSAGAVRLAFSAAVAAVA